MVAVRSNRVPASEEAAINADYQMLGPYESRPFPPALYNLNPGVFSQSALLLIKRPLLAVIQDYVDYRQQGFHAGQQIVHLRHARPDGGHYDLAVNMPGGISEDNRLSLGCKDDGAPKHYGVLGTENLAIYQDEVAVPNCNLKANPARRPAFNFVIPQHSVPRYLEAAKQHGRRLHEIERNGKSLGEAMGYLPQHPLKTLKAGDLEVTYDAVGVVLDITAGGRKKSSQITTMGVLHVAQQVVSDGLRDLMQLPRLQRQAPEVVTVETPGLTSVGAAWQRRKKKEPKAAKPAPQPVAPPEPVVAAPEPVVAAPEPVVAAPQPVAEPVAAKPAPQPVAAPEPVAVEPVAAPRPEPVATVMETRLVVRETRMLAPGVIPTQAQIDALWSVLEGEIAEDEVHLFGAPLFQKGEPLVKEHCAPLIAAHHDLPDEGYGGALKQFTREIIA